MKYGTSFVLETKNNLKWENYFEKLDNVLFTEDNLRSKFKGFLQKKERIKNHYEVAYQSFLTDDSFLEIKYVLEEKYIDEKKTEWLNLHCKVFSNAERNVKTISSHLEDILKGQIIKLGEN
jgi:hypothetical protein